MTPTEISLPCYIDLILQSAGPSSSMRVFVMHVMIIPWHMNPASILYKSIAGRYRPVSYPDGPITAR